MIKRRFNQQGSKVLKIDLSNLLPPEVLDKTRSTEKMVLGAILNHQDTVNDQMKLVLDEGVQAEDFHREGPEGRRRGERRPGLRQLGVPASGGRRDQGGAALQRRGADREDDGPAARHRLRRGVPRQRGRAAGGGARERGAGDDRDQGRQRARAPRVGAHRRDARDQRLAHRPLRRPPSPLEECAPPARPPE